MVFNNTLTSFISFVIAPAQVLAFRLLIEKMLLQQPLAPMDATGADHGPESVGGQAFFISDGSPIENFEFLRPLCVARGRRYPALVVPTAAMLWVSALLERVYYATRSMGVPVEPALTQAEVLKVGVTHYFSIEKAQRLLGYQPQLSSEEGALRLAKHYGAHVQNDDFFEFSAVVWVVSIMMGLVLLAIAAFADAHQLQAGDYSVLMQGVYWLAVSIFQSQPNLQIVFYSAAAIHVAESIVALAYAVRIGCKNTMAMWWLQTLLFGYPSLRLLLRREQWSRRTRPNVPLQN